MAMLTLKVVVTERNTRVHVIDNNNGVTWYTPAPSLTIWDMGTSPVSDHSL